MQKQKKCYFRYS